MCSMKKITTTFLALLLIVWCHQAAAQLAATPWPKPGRDAGNTSVAADVPVAMPFIKWRVDGTAGVTFEGVMIDTEGNVVFKGPWGEPSFLTSVNSSGIVWEKEGVGSWDWGNPVAASGGRLYAEHAKWATAGNNELAAYNAADGAEIWAMPLTAPNDCTPTIGSDGTIYVTAGAKLMAVSDDGSSYSVI